MKLGAFLTSRNNVILDKWFEVVLADYPAETARFMGCETDPFSNPVGFHLRRGLEELYGEIQTSKASIDVCKSLEQLLKIRAVQDFPPSQAVSFLLNLKGVIREQWEKEFPKEEMPWRELMELESRIETLTLLAFDIYSECREKLFKIRIKELKDSIPRVFREINDKQCLGYSVNSCSLVTGSEG